MLDRNIFIGFAAGIVAGIVGYKVYEQNKDTIDSRLKNLGICSHGQCKAEEQTSEDTCECVEMTLEELEAQKERLEDLIAEQQAKAAQSGCSSSADCGCNIDLEKKA